MLQALRKYGFLIFALPLIIFWVDDFLTNWHHHGHDTALQIVRENLVEDVITLSAWMLVRWVYLKWVRYVTAQIHCVCPRCNFAWTMHPKEKVEYCPHCGLPEPGTLK